MSQPTQIPAEEVIAGYQQALADANHRALTAEALARALTAELNELREKQEPTDAGA